MSDVDSYQSPDGERPGGSESASKNAAEHALKRKQSRKSTHQPLNPEFEFQTLSAFEGQEKKRKIFKASNKRKSAARAKTPDLLGMESEEPEAACTSTTAMAAGPKNKEPKTVTEKLMHAHALFHLSPNTQKKLRRIAKERVRINFLLGIYGMPEMCFAMKTPPTRLQFQLEDRLKHWKMRNVDATRMSERSKMRSVGRPIVHNGEPSVKIEIQDLTEEESIVI